MKIRRALGLAVLGYVITMVVGVAIAYFAGIDMTQMAENPPMWCWIVSAVFAIIVTGLMSYWYFSSSKVAKGAAQGVYFGIVMVLVGVVLDIVSIVPAYGWGPFIQYYSMPIFWVTLVVVVIVAALVGKKATK